MSSLVLSTDETSLQEQAANAMDAGDYATAMRCYEQLVEISEKNLRHRWYLGLTYLLHGYEEEAQMTWTFALINVDEQQSEDCILELTEILEGAAQRQQEEENLEGAWLIRQHLREISPHQIFNLLASLQLAIALNHSLTEELQSSNLIQCFQSQPQPQENCQSSRRLSQQLLAVLPQVLKHLPEDPLILEFIQAAIPHVQATPALIELLLEQARQFGSLEQMYLSACELIELVLKLDADNMEALAGLNSFGIHVYTSSQMLAIAERYYQHCQTPLQQMLGNAFLLRALLQDGSRWEQFFTTTKQLRSQIEAWLTEDQLDSDEIFGIGVFTLIFYYFLFEGDHPEAIRPLQNQVMLRCRQYLERDFARHFSPCQLEQKFAPSIRGSQRPLRIGYLSKFLSRHSVGWLARWLIQHHDRDRFKTYVYHIQQSRFSHFTHQWYIEPTTQSSCLNGSILESAEKIYEDKIDILVDLDSLTSDLTCNILLYKPAPIQVSWLGLDASGLPTIDYYIADPYVLPESAQTYYAEQIWRLPHTYLAVDGFEVGVTTLRRSDLGIPEDAVIYWSAQATHKRYPDTIQLQLQILKAVPNSFFLIKGSSTDSPVQQLFFSLAKSIDLETNRLIFLPKDADEETHRANLAIADVVLDTFPYNGATTTLETLWMGVPVVTKVGQQFAARNSYTMMINAGITEGIAWNDAEYIEWGIRLGTDAALRQDIHWRLLRSRQSAPLWNAKQFTREMEKAYEQMWQIYQNCHCDL